MASITFFRRVLQLAYANQKPDIPPADVQMSLEHL